MTSNVLIVLLGDLGDTILTVPALHAIRRRHANARLTLLSKAASGAYVLDLGLVDEVIAIDKHALDRIGSLSRPGAVLETVRVARRLRRTRPDVLVIFQHLSTRWGALKFAALVLGSGARERLGLDNGRGWFLTRRVPDRGFGALHESEYWLQVAGLLDAPGEIETLSPVRDVDRAAARWLLHEAGTGGKPLLAIHPGVGPYGPGRQWGPLRFAQAAERILHERPMTCVIVGTDSDREAADAVIARLGPRCVSLVGRTSARQLAAVLERCDLLLANDGGVAHLASAVGTPTIVVFGPSNDAAWRPLGAHVVAADIPCRPCFYHDFQIGLRNGCATRECLAVVTPARVAALAHSILGDARLAV